MAGALFELLIDGPPVSQQARWRSRVREYRAEIRRLATSAYGARAPYSGTARVEITILFELASGDVDNFAKPILDALKGVVLADDGQVMDLLLRKRPFGVVHFTEPSAAVLDRLAARQEFVHLIVLPLVL